METIEYYKDGEEDNMDKKKIRKQIQIGLVLFIMIIILNPAKDFASV